jgi:hypothetical protein
MLKVSRTAHSLPIVIVLLTAAAVTPARGETVLRWKFQPGEKLRCVMNMKMTGKLDFGSTPTTTTSVQVMEMSWEIKSVDAEGVASVTQTIDRLRMKMESPEGVMIDYDSDANGETAGISKVMVPFFEAMVNKPTSLKMDPRGHVSDVQVPQAMIDAANKVPGMGAIGEMLSGETIGKISGGGTLPQDAVSEGDTWTNEAEFNLPMLGKMKALATYKYLGSETRNGRALEKIGYTQKIDISPAQKQPGYDAKITDQSASGTIYFDNVAGRFTESSLKSKMNTEITVAGKTVKSDVETVVHTKLESAGTSEKPTTEQ